MRFKKYLFFALLLISANASAKFFGINVFRPWNINLRPDPWPGEPRQVTYFFERGIKSRGFNPDNKSVNVLQLYTPKQDGLAMLKGFPADSPMSEFFTDVLRDPQDNGVRGNFTVCGDFDLAVSSGFAFRYHLPCYDLSLGVFLPVYAMSLKNVSFFDCTRDITEEDMRVKEEFTDKFKEVVHEFDPTLNLCGWDRAGVGDLAFIARYFRCFPQDKPYLKNVGITMRAGLTVPTGLRENVDDIMSVAFGFDGSFGLIGNIGIWVNWFDHIRAGINFQFLHLFGNTREHRIKTQMDQTDFLLLAKTKAYLDYGFTQQYNLYLQAYRVFHGLSAGFIYEFSKHSPDTLVLCTDEYSSIIANTAESLKEWTLHEMILSAWYDFQCDLYDESILKPQLQFFVKVPFNGKRAVLVETVGFGITLNF